MYSKSKQYSMIKGIDALKPTFAYYEMTREEKMEDAFRRYNVIANLNRKEFLDEATVNDYNKWQGLHVDGGYNPLSVHGMMFLKTIENLGTD